MTKTKGELIGTLCFGKEGLEKKDLRKNQLRIPVIKSDKIDKDSTVTMVKSPKKVSQGKKNRRDGKAFELKVRADLESKGWIVFRNSNDVQPSQITITGEKGKVIEEEIEWIFKQAKSKWNPFTHSPMTLQSGFPDFVCIKTRTMEMRTKTSEKIIVEKDYCYGFDVQFVECKTNGTLDKIEREKVEWIKNNLKIPVFVASQDYPEENINIKPTKRKKMIIKYEEK